MEKTKLQFASIEKWALFFVAGSGIFTFIWFLINWIGIPFNLCSELLIMVLLLAIFIKFIKPTLRFNLAYFEKLNLFEKVSIFTILLLCATSLIQTIYWPIRYWDSLVLYDFRALLFANTGHMSEAIANGYFFGYPLHTSLVHTSIYLLGVTNPLFYYSILYICLIIISFVNFQRFGMVRQTSLMFTLIVAVCPMLFDHTQWGYTNLPYAIYIILGSLYLYWGIKYKNLSSYIVSSLLIGLSTWTRTAEPFWLGYIALAILFALSVKKWFWPFLYIFITEIFVYPWKSYQHFDLGSSLISPTGGKLVVPVGLFTHIAPVTNFLIASVLNVYTSFFILISIVLIIKLFMRSKKWLWIIMIFANLGMVILGTLIFSLSQTYWQDIPDSVSRMVMFIPVMVIFLTAEVISEWKQR